MECCKVSTTVLVFVLAWTVCDFFSFEIIKKSELKTKYWQFFQKLKQEKHTNIKVSPSKFTYKCRISGTSVHEEKSFFFFWGVDPLKRLEVAILNPPLSDEILSTLRKKIVLHLLKPIFFKLNPLWFYLLNWSTFIWSNQILKILRISWVKRKNVWKMQKNVYEIRNKFKNNEMFCSNLIR